MGEEEIWEQRLGGGCGHRGYCRWHRSSVCSIWDAQRESWGLGHTLSFLREVLWTPAVAVHKNHSRSTARPPLTILWLKKHWLPNQNSPCYLHPWPTVPHKEIYNHLSPHLPSVHLLPAGNITRLSDATGDAGMPSACVPGLSVGIKTPHDLRPHHGRSSRYTDFIQSQCHIPRIAVGKSPE